MSRVFLPWPGERRNADYWDTDCIVLDRRSVSAPLPIRDRIFTLWTCKTNIICWETHLPSQPRLEAAVDLATLPQDPRNQSSAY